MKNKKMPVIALSGMTVLPNMVLHVDISGETAKKSAEEAMAGDQLLFLVTMKENDTVNPTIKDLFSFGTIAEVKQIFKTHNSNVSKILVEGVSRGSLVSLENVDGILLGEVVRHERIVAKPDMMLSKAIVSGLHEMIRQYMLYNSDRISRDVVEQWLNIDYAPRLLDSFMTGFPMTYDIRQTFLEADTVEEQYEIAGKLLIEETDVGKIRKELNEKVRKNVELNQKEYLLREELKVISEELDGEDAESEIDEFINKTNELNVCDEVKDKIKKEIKRYKKLGNNSPESSISRGYIETLLSLPWDAKSEDNKNIEDAVRILDEDHYGLTKVKERIVDALAVRNITDKGDAPIICLVGPPGTGKTSIAKSVARALNKEYVRICLGGVRDEAEIRGHRRTYIGAMPGRIIKGIKEAGVKNPLMLLDEIDKMSSDYKGDTASALLEVLDSEQNMHFVDHYVEIPADLSQVLFIATANDISTISRPLLDRMEVIELNSYTANEKMHIAEEHLMPKQMLKNGLQSSQLKISTAALKKVIADYTREAGVRSLEREIAAICRKTVRLLYENGTLLKKTIRVSERNLVEFLGKEKFIKEDVNRKNEVGIVQGLAWTSVGGETLEIEVNTMNGKGELILTGQMGDVMQESAQIALSYVKSQVDGKFFENNNLHLHIPEGAVPKDGPSAGVTMATAIYSAVMDRKVDAHLAMTGEITLRGNVLPIGGLKEKLLAANTAGMKRVLVPLRNKPDVLELDKEITDGMTIEYVSTMKQVLNSAIVK